MSIQEGKLPSYQARPLVPEVLPDQPDPPVLSHRVALGGLLDLLARPVLGRPSRPYQHRW